MNMLNEHTLNQLRSLRLDGMVAALNDAATHITASELPFEQRLALLVQREVDWRDSKRLERLLKAARLKVSSACLEDIDWRGWRVRWGSRPRAWGSRCSMHARPACSKSCMWPTATAALANAWHNWRGWTC
jgi:hypothetical protein